jgi:hypothetical protein
LAANNILLVESIIASIISIKMFGDLEWSWASLPTRSGWFWVLLVLVVIWVFLFILAQVGATKSGLANARLMKTVYPAGGSLNTSLSHLGSDDSNLYRINGLAGQPGGADIANPGKLFSAQSHQHSIRSNPNAPVKKSDLSEANLQKTLYAQ